MHLFALVILLSFLNASDLAISQMGLFEFLVLCMEERPDFVRRSPVRVVPDVIVEGTVAIQPIFHFYRLAMVRNRCFIL